MRDRITRLLSLLFSVYSPLYPIDALFIRILGRRDKWGLIGLALLCIAILGFTGETGLFIFVVAFSTYGGLIQFWTGNSKRYSTCEGITVYPIHAVLRQRITRLTGYKPTGTELYEIHIDPKLVKRVDNPIRAGMLVTRAAKDVTAELGTMRETVSVIGTTYEARLAAVATAGAKRNLQHTVRRQGVCPLGAKWLFPHRIWDTFIWEIDHRDR